VLLLSVLVHALALYSLPPLRLEMPGATDPDFPIAVELMPRLQPPQGVPVLPEPQAKAGIAPPAAVPQPKPQRAEPPPRRAEPPRPPAIAHAPPAPESTPAPVEPLPAPREQARAPSSGDLSSYIESRRRARAESPPAPARQGNATEAPSEDDTERSRRAIAANLGLGQAPTFGGPPKHGGGIFQITRLTYSNAEFLFYGWNKDIRRNTTQLIEVRKGEHSDIKHAVIRRMIGIVREHESGDFEWVSHRLGRVVTLSARASDNAGLEDFLMREFFGELRGS
jgi:hypothetical protein